SRCAPSCVLPRCDAFRSDRRRRSSGHRRRRGVARARSTERGEHIADLGVIAGEAVSPLEARPVAWSQHEGAALLDWISAARALPEAMRECADGLPHAPRVEGSAPAVREARGAEDAERWIGEEWSRVPGRLAEPFDVLGLAATHDHQ